MDNAQLSRRALLVMTGSATLATVLAGRQVTAAASTQAPNAAPVPLISLTSQASGTFTRVRAVDDDTRLYLSYPGAAGILTGQRVTAPGYYGLHFTAYPAGQHADQYLQDLFDNTPLGYLGFYFKTIGHPGGSWAGKATGLLTQGWNLVPIYVGRQQYWPHTTDNQISAHTATAASQGKKDGEKAVTLATSEKLPRHSRLYLDTEATQYTSGPSKGKNGPPTASAIAYMKAWLAAVSASGKYVGALYDVNSRWTQSGKTYYDAVRIQSDLGRAAPTTWVAWNPGRAPVGVTAGAWPRDPNGDVAAVGVKAYSTNPQWEYASFAQSWQFTLNWLPAGAYFLTDTGAPRSYTAIAPGLDFDVSKSDDPGNTAPGHPKSRRRPAVSAVTVGSATVKPGKSVEVTLKLDRPAPAPNGAVVLLRSTSPQLILPSSARVAAKATSVTVSATAAVGSPAGSVTVRARVLHQLSGTPPQTMIKIAP